MKLNVYKSLTLAVGCLLTIIVLFASCKKADNGVPIKEPERYKESDIKSYADLFTVFWKVMDQQYNYFYEQKEKTGMDWDAIYKQYYPKFEALKSYKRDGFSNTQIQDDADKAFEYFSNIVDPIIDRHFSVKITLPYDKKNPISKDSTFYGGMKSAGNPNSSPYTFQDKYNYLVNNIDNAELMPNTIEDKGFNILFGDVKNAPDIKYITFRTFFISLSLAFDATQGSIHGDPTDRLFLTSAKIEASAQLNQIKDAAVKAKVKNKAIDILNEWNAFFNSTDVNIVNEQINVFKNTEVFTDALFEAAERITTTAATLPDYHRSGFASITEPEAQAFISWFSTQMGEHVNTVHGYDYFLNTFLKSIDALLPLYKNFLNPLHKGSIKKLIIDLRGNGGGLVKDIETFVSRFVTKNAIWSYQRTKEGNGRFNYTPWVPLYSQTHRFGLPANIPIVILTDRKSASMSEITTMMLKSQGPQVISMGDYTYGATAGLGTTDNFNGGIQANIADVFEFNMPLMAAKDANGDVIEGIGVKPNIYVAPPTEAEVLQMKNSPNTYKDRVMEAAVKYLSSK